MAPVCISDSRGRYLGDSLSNVLYKGEHLYSFFFHPGAKLTNLKDKVEGQVILCNRNEVHTAHMP